MSLIFLLLLGLGAFGQLVLWGMSTSQRYADTLSWAENSVVVKYIRNSFYIGAMGLVWFHMGAEIFLVLLTVLLVAIALLDKYLWEPKRGGQPSQYEILKGVRDNWVLFLVFFSVRTFVVQHYRVPTGSLEPTVQVGDFLLVNQFSYGWHLPIWNTKLLSWGKPKVGDIAVFRYPRDPLNLLYVKRVVGVPGDHIVYRDKHLTINGQLIKQDYIEMNTESSKDWASDGLLAKRREYLPGVTHDIFVRSESYGPYDDIDLVVPEGTYFMMGDNRDNSFDSRAIGPVEEKFLVGRALLVLFGWEGWWPTWKRTGLLL